MENENYIQIRKFVPLNINITMLIRVGFKEGFDLGIERSYC
jgi:hypothetical protein